MLMILNPKPRSRISDPKEQELKNAVEFYVIVMTPCVAQTRSLQLFFLSGPLTLCLHSSS